MDFNTHKKKASIRTLKFPGGFPTPDILDDLLDDPNCWPIPFQDLEITTPGVGATGPTIAVGGLAQDAEIKIFGQDYDDTPVGCKRYVTARLKVKDYNDELWYVYYGRRVAGLGSFYAPCGDYMIVERLDNVDNLNPGKSQWKFSTAGVGYVYRDNRPPHIPTEF